MKNLGKKWIEVSVMELEGDEDKYQLLNEVGCYLLTDADGWVFFCTKSPEDYAIEAGMLKNTNNSEWAAWLNQQLKDTPTLAPIPAEDPSLRAVFNMRDLERLLISAAGGNPDAK